VGGVRAAHECALDHLVAGRRGAVGAMDDGIRLVVLADVADRPIDPDEIGHLTDEVIGILVRLIGDRVERHAVAPLLLSTSTRSGLRTIVVVMYAYAQRDAIAKSRTSACVVLRRLSGGSAPAWRGDRAARHEDRVEADLADLGVGLLDPAHDQVGCRAR